MVPDPLADLARLDGVPSALAAARDAVDLRLRDRGLRSLTTEQRVAALLAGAEASAEMTDDPERWRPGSVRVATELLSLSAVIRVAPGQALARAHVLAASGAVPDDALGRIRTAPEVADRMQGLVALLSGSAGPTRAPALVLAAVAHAEIATVRPFGSADRLVARAVERMVLVSSGVDPQGSIPVEAGHLSLIADYEHRLRGYAQGTVTGVRNWLVHCAAALVEAAGWAPC